MAKLETCGEKGLAQQGSKDALLEELEDFLRENAERRLCMAAVDVEHFKLDEAGCNWEQYSPSMREKLKQRQQLLIEIERALQNKEFCFYLQPKCNSMTRAIVGTTVGTKATIVPLVVAAFPFVARLVETSLRELDEGVVEAAQSMGATPFQIITKVMIPECLPGLISSMTTALTTILGYSAMSGVIGGGGLGKIALSYGYYRYQTNIMIVCVVLLVLMVQVFQTVGTLWATKSDKRLRK